MKRNLFAFSFIAASIFITCTASAAVNTVCFSGCNSSSIQDVVYSSSAYDEVMITERTTAGISTSGLKAYYPFDGLTGNLTNAATALNSTSSLGADGNMSVRPNTIRTSGKLGGAFWYVANGGPYGYSEVHSGSNTTKWEFLHYQSGTTKMSMNLWIRLTEYPTSSRAAIYSDARTVFSENGMEMLLKSTRVLGVVIRGSQTVLSMDTQVDALPADGSFHMVTLVIDSADTNSSNAARIYVDNQLKAASNINTVFMVSGAPTRSPTIGSSAEATYTNSTMDEFSIWDRALTDGERSALWNGGSGAVLGNYSQYNENVVVNVTGLTLTSNTSARPVIWASSSSATITVSANNVTVKNLTVVYNGTTDSLSTITASDRFNLTVANNTINNTGLSDFGYGIDFTTTEFSLIRNNVINTASGIENYGVYLSSGNSNNISSNVISTDGTGGSNYGIYLTTSSSSNNISSNIISTNGTAENYGIFIDASSTNTVFGNNISTHGTGSSNLGLYLLGSAYQNIYGNDIYTSGSGSGNIGIYLDSSYNNFTYNNISTNGSATSNDGVYMASCNGNMFDNIRITTGGLSDSRGMYINNVQDTLFSNINITTYSVDGSPGTCCMGGILLQGDIMNTNITDSVIHVPNASDIHVEGTSNSGYSANLINVTFNKTDMKFANSPNNYFKVFVMYRVGFRTVGTNGSAISGATVVGNDTGSVSNLYNPTSNFTGTTNSTGYIPQQTLAQFMANFTYNSSTGGIGYLYFTNYTITASKSGYDGNSTSLNVTDGSSTSMLLRLAVALGAILGKDSNSYELGYDGIYGNLYAFVNSVNASYSLPSGWSHVAMTFDSGTIKLYLNGQLVGTGGTSATPNDNGRSVILGNGSTLKVDEVRFYARPLSDGEISQHHSVGSALKAVVSAVGSGSFGRNFNVSVLTDEGNYAARYTLPTDLLTGTIGSVNLQNVSGTPRSVVVTSNSCRQTLDATDLHLRGVYC